MSDNNVVIPQAQTAAHFFKRQAWHLSLLAVLIYISTTFAAPSLGDGNWLGVADKTWFWMAISLAVLQQLLVWIVFRSQLGWGLLTRLLGKADLVVWGILFMPLLIARPVFLFGLAMSDQDSMTLPRIVELTLGLVLLPPALYALYSVKRYFGIERALGGDHFRKRYREMPMVREGAFRWSGNAMYAFAFLLLWSIAFLSGSLAALSVAFFQHAYVWVHYYCTEEPDMTLIYGPNQGQ